MGAWGWKGARAGSGVCAGSRAGRASRREQMKAPPPGGGGGAALRSPPLSALTRFSTSRLAPRQSPAGPTKPLCAWKAGECPAGLTPTRAATGRGPAGTQSVWDGGGGEHPARGPGHVRVNYAEGRGWGGRGASANRRSEGATVTNKKDRDPATGVVEVVIYPQGCAGTLTHRCRRVWARPVYVHKAPGALFSCLFREQRAWRQGDILLSGDAAADI